MRGGLACVALLVALTSALPPAAAEEPAPKEAAGPRTPQATPDTQGPVDEPASSPAPESPAAQPPPNANEPLPQAPQPKPSEGPPAPGYDPRPPLGIFPTPEDALMDPRMARSWGEAPPRYFIATALDIGFVYVRPRVSIGYGRPFTKWIGIDANPVVSGAGIGAYGGLRFALPFGDLRVGPRYFYAFNHTDLAVKRNYKRLELETSSGENAKTLTYEAELDFSIPLGPGSVITRGSVSYVTGVSDDRAVFEETLRLIVRPPLVWRARGGYAFRFGHYNQHSIAFVADILNVPKRDDSTTLRIGPIMRFVLSRRVELRGSFVMTLVSPDNIGLVGGDFTELGVRYRWASE